MNKNKKYTIEFKKEAIKLVTEHNYTVKDAAERLDINPRNLYNWIGRSNNKHENSKGKKSKLNQEHPEISKLRKEIARLKLEREILKKAAAFFANEPQ